ncbi:hypothetical protein IGI39_003655 [Enterococcus sp. AZ135]
MTIFLNVLFAIELALLLTHEMDAVRHKEWQMFIGLKDLPEGTAYWLFTLPHIILYTLIIVFLLLNHPIILLIVDIFLICHLFVHHHFRNHPNNQVTNFWSKLIIHSAGIIAGVHLVLHSIH